MELYFFPTPNAQRALIALEESGLPYSLRIVDLYKGEQNEESFGHINKARAIPVLVDQKGPGDQRLVLTQSVAICIYVAEKSRRLIPSDPGQRLEMFEWMMLAASDVAGTNTAINQLRRSAPEKSETNCVFFEERLIKYMALCDDRLKGNEYLAGDFSLADVCLYPFIFAKRQLLDQRDKLHNLRSWKERVEARPAVSKAMSVSASP